MTKSVIDADIMAIRLLDAGYTESEADRILKAIFKGDPDKENENQIVQMRQDLMGVHLDFKRDMELMRYNSKIQNDKANILIGITALSLFLLAVIMRYRYGIGGY